MMEMFSVVAVVIVVVIVVRKTYKPRTNFIIIGDPSPTPPKRNETEYSIKTKQIKSMPISLQESLRCLPQETKMEVSSSTVSENELQCTYINFL